MSAALAANQRNFLLSAEAKKLKPIDASALKSDEAYERFKDVRYGWQGGKPYCPHCGHEKIYEHNTRSTFKCASCGRHFSVTTRTVFASRKLPYGTILKAIALRLHAPKNALQSSYDLGVTYKTSAALAKTFRVFGNIKPDLKWDRWPYNNTLNPSVDLLASINSLLPYALPEQVRADVAQDIVVGVLTGDVSEANLSSEVQKYIRSHYRRMEWRFDTVSLNQPVYGTENLSWDDTLDSERAHF